jgi:hypothetical protein
VNYFVYDPQPIDREGPVLVGPFATKDEAEEYANVTHPDDGSGNAVVLQPEEAPLP